MPVVQIANEKNTKSFTTLFFREGDLIAKDGTTITYRQSNPHHECRYLEKLHTQGQPVKEFYYTKLRHGVGRSLAAIRIGGRRPSLIIEYYTPPNETSSLKWEKKPHKKPYEIDKVKTVQNPDGIQATFEYEPSITSMRDAFGALTRYHHSDDKLDMIEYFGDGDTLVATQKFIWKDGLLMERTMQDANGNKIFSKNFDYDSYKNVIKETIQNSEESFSKNTGDSFGSILTPQVHSLSKFQKEFMDLFKQYNPNAKWAHIAHSRGGLEFRNAYELQAEKMQRMISNRCYYLGVAPARVSPISYYHAINIFSDQDKVTLRYTKDYIGNKDYDIRILPCITPKEQLSFIAGDHSFANPTYQVGVKRFIKDLGNQVGFYVQNSR